MTNFPLVAGVVTHTQEVIPGLNTPAFMFTRVWTAPERKTKTRDGQHFNNARLKILHWACHVFLSILLLHIVQNMICR